MSERIAEVFVVLLLLAYLATFAYQVYDSGLDSTIVTHVVPFAISVGILGLPLLARVRIRSPFRLFRIAHVLATMPWVVPVTLVILIAPLFSEDFWRLAGEFDADQILKLGAVTVLPMGVIVCWHLLVTKFDEVIGETANQLRITPGSRPDGERTIDDAIDEIERVERSRTALSADLRLLWRAVRRRWAQRTKPKQPKAALTDDELMLRESFASPAFPYYVRYVRARLKGTFRAQMIVRVILLVAGVGVGFAAYIYAIAWISISAEQARMWTGRTEVATWDTGLGFSIPTGPHVWVAVLMAVIATAIFLALVITTREMESALADSFTQGPLRRCFLVALPFVNLYGTDGISAAEKIRGPSGSRYINVSSESKRHASPGRAWSWYRWTAPDDRKTTIDTATSACDTSLAIYDGSIRVLVGADDDPHGLSRVSFPAARGEDYVIVVDGFHEQDEIEEGELVLNWLTNDDFEAAERIEGASGTARGNNAAATKEPGERDHAENPGGASVWYRWTAPASGQVTFDTHGSSFDTLLAVYTGSSVRGLDEVAANDDVAPGLHSGVRFSADQGTEYVIAVDGYKSPLTEVQRGEIVLNWGPPANDRFDRAQTIVGSSGTTSGNSTAATKQPGERDHAGDPGGASVWYRWTAPSSGQVTFDTQGSSFDTLLAVYVGSNLESLEPVVANDDHPALGLQSRVSFPAAQGSEYMIAVDGYGGAAGEIALNWELVLSPSNDDFLAAHEIDDHRGKVTGTNRGATKEPGERDHAGDPGGASVWYRWTAPSSGQVTFDTQGSSFDTLLAVYAGVRVDDVVEVTANDDEEALGFQSRVRFPAEEGAEYMIALDGFGGQTGDVVLNWSYLPDNDGFTSAQVIVGSSGSVAGENRGATKQPGERDHADNAGGASVWYRWTAPSSGQVTFDTQGSSFDTLLAVYVGSNLETLEPVVANDDHPALGLQSRVSFPAAQGSEYMIAVDGYGGAAGEIALNWELFG